MCRKLVFTLLIVGLTACVAQADLVSHWTLDEGAGKIAYDSGPGGNDGILQDNPALENPTWIAGVIGGAMEFYGTGVAGTGGDFFNCGSDPSLAITGPISIALWIRPDADDPEGKGAAGGETAPLSKATGDWMWQVRYGWHTATPYMGFQFNTSPRTWVYTDRKLERYEWVHIACSHDGETVKCYLNGEETDSAPMGQITSNNTPVLIGSDGWGSDWTGAIDDVRIYDHGISEGELLAIMSPEPVPTAYGPTPKDGAMIMATATLLKWQPGAYAHTHDVYFGDSLEAVSAATPDDADVYAGRLGVEMMPVGAEGNPYPQGLIPGTTYYWRVDEVNDTEPNSPWKGNVWSFSIQPVTAFNPYPADGMKYVDPDQDLIWDAGMGALFHTVFFEESFEEASNATQSTWMTTEPTLDVGTLELDKTYYWRVDEFTTSAQTHKGPVWSFTTRGEGGGVKAEYFAGMDLAGDPVLTQIEPSIDHAWGSGEVAAGLSDSVSARWRANLEAPFTETFTLITTSDDGVRLWLDDRLVIDNWTDHGTTDNTAKVDLVKGQIYLIRMEYYENSGGAVAQLSWESPTIPRQFIPQGWLQLPFWATVPSPVNGEPHAIQTPILTWTAGDEATAHDVYFGEDAEAVANATPADAAVYRGQQAAGATSFNPGPLEWGKTYYWRVDEINPANADSPWKGCVRSFTTADFLLVEDFESYTNEVGSRVFEKWVDGIGYSMPEPGHPGNSTGASVGHDIWSVESKHYNGSIMETDDVHGGYLAMPLYYNNTASPYRSEAERTWTVAQDWTSNGVDTVTLYVMGNPGNGVTPLYVAIEDAAGHVGVVSHPDAEVVTKLGWTEWNIPASEFTAAGVSMTAVKKMYIGLGSRTAATPDGTGMILVDDIRITKAAAQ